MRHLVYICRPCLASIRKQQSEALLRRTVFSQAMAPPTSRPRIRTLAALHALRSKSTAAANPRTDLETVTDFEDFARAVEAESETKNAPAKKKSKRTPATAPAKKKSKRKPATGAHPPRYLETTTNLEDFFGAAHHDTDATTATGIEEFFRPFEGEAGAGASTESSLSATGPSIPGSTTGEECSTVYNDPRWHWLSKNSTGPPRSPDVEWKEVEAALFREDERAKSKYGINIEPSSTADEWEAFCTANSNTTKSSHILSYCWTVEDYFRAIELDSNIKHDRQVRETMARDKWVAQFREVEQQSRNRARGSPLLALAEIPEPAYVELREKWERLSPLARDSRWTSVITKCLKTWPEGLPLVIAATADPGIARPYILEYVIRIMAHQIPKMRDPQRFADAVVDSLLSVLSRMGPDSVRVTQPTVYSIMKFASIHQAYELYTGLKKCGWRISLHTKTQFASRFAKDLSYRSSCLEVLRDMVEENNFNINSLGGTALATSMLAMRNESAYSETRQRAVPRPEVNEEVYNMLLGIGLRPNVINLTAIMQSMCEIGQLGKAWEVYDVMQGMGIEPDVQVFLILLHGSKLHEDYDSAERAIRLAKESGILHRCLWNEVLHIILLSAVKSPRGRGRRVLPIFPAMCHVYNKFFHQEHLQRFMITDMKHHSLEISPETLPPAWLWPLIRRSWGMISALPSCEPMQPGIDTVYIMLKGYARGFTRPSSIIAFYTHIQELLKTGDPIAVDFVKVAGPKLHNLIIKAACAHRSMLRFALDIVSNMIKDSIQARRAAAAAGRIPEEDDQVLCHPAPDIRTWGVLQRGFIAHRRYREAYEILDIMERQGCRIDLKILNQMLGVFTRSKQKAEALNVMARIKRAGLTPDRLTRMYARRLLKRLGDKEKTPEVMELLNTMGQVEEYGPLLLKEGMEDDEGKPDFEDQGLEFQQGEQHQDALDEYQQLEAELSQTVDGIPQSSGATVNPSVWAETEG